MRVLLYTHTFPPSVGGMERFGEDLAGWLAQRGIDVIVATDTLADGSFDPHRDYTVIRRPRSPRFAREIIRADVVHVQGLALRGAAPAMLLGRPFVMTHTSHQAVCPNGMAWTPAGCTAGPVRGPCERCPDRGAAGSLDVLAHRTVAARAGTNVAVSEYLARRLGLPHTCVVYNPVHPRAFERAWSGSVDGATVAFAGRHVREKGLSLLLHALARLPWVRLVVAGEGPLGQRWRSLAADLEIENRVEFVGTMSASGVLDLFASADVACVPSVWDEPFGYVAAEAMASGCPVVATPAGALGELLGSGRGFLAPDTSVEGLRRALSEALSDRKQRHRVGAAARRFAEEEFRLERIGERYLDLYRQQAA